MLEPYPETILQTPADILGKGLVRVICQWPFPLAYPQCGCDRWEELALVLVPQSVGTQAKQICHVHVLVGPPCMRAGGVP